MVDVGELAGAVVPYLSAAAGAYGAAVVQRVSDQASDATADATLGLGRRLLRRLGGSSRSVQVEEAVTDLADDPQDADLEAAVRVQVRKALTEDPDLVADLAALLTEAGVGRATSSVSVAGSQGVQVGDHNTQTNTFGTAPR